MATKPKVDKRKMVRKMLTPEEHSKLGKKEGFIVFEAKEWQKRRENIADRVARKEAKAKELKAIRLEKSDKEATV